MIKQNICSQNNKGLTLVETLITLGFASLLILALVSLTTFNVRNSLLVTENQDAINSANKLLEDIRSTRDKEFSRLYVNSHKCDSPLSYCSINPSTLTVISLTESMVDTSTAPISYFNYLNKIDLANPPTELNVRITTVWTIGSSQFSSAFNTIFTNWRVN